MVVDDRFLFAVKPVSLFTGKDHAITVPALGG